MGVKAKEEGLFNDECYYALGHCIYEEWVFSAKVLRIRISGCVWGNTRKAGISCHVLNARLLLNEHSDGAGEILH